MYAYLKTGSCWYLWTCSKQYKKCPWANPEGEGGGAGGQTPPPGKSQVAICFLRNTGTDPLEKQLDLKGPC